MADDLKIAVFASGRGSNLEAILKAIKTGKITGAEVVAVISNNPGAGALQTARTNGIPALHISRMQFESEGEFDTQLLKALDNHRVNFIALAGYMKKVSPAVISRFRNRIVNIHPALLPEFGGAGMYGGHVHRAVIAARKTVSGATVHIVDEAYDRGPIVLQKSMPVTPDDTPETLAEKVLKLEHEIYPEAIQLFADGKVTVKENKASVLQ